MHFSMGGCLAPILDLEYLIPSPLSTSRESIRFFFKFSRLSISELILRHIFMVEFRAEV